jgi:uncharacterized RDD family membrane protein YckC
MSGPQSPGPRAGFWRRASAAFIDMLIVAVPIQILVVPLFLLTNGAVQFHGGITYKNCANPVQISELPPGLNPPPPENSNFAFICRTSFFGWPTAQSLTVERRTKEGNVTKTIWRAYPLGADGKPRSAWSLDGWALVLLFAYLILSENRFGRTIGKKLIGIRVVDLLHPERTGVPLGKVIARHALIWAGIFPMLIAFFVSYAANGGNIEAMARGNVFTWVTLAAIFFVGWTLWIVVQVARKHDPVYDVVAGTAVLKQTA